MSNIKLFSLFLLLSIYICQSIRLSSTTISALNDIRGGAKGVNKNVKKAYGKQSVKKIRIEEDDDDDQDDEDEDEEEHVPIRSSNKKRGKMALSVIPRRLPKPRKGFFPTSLFLWKSSNKNKKGKGPTIKDRLEQVAKIGQSAYKDIYRRAKVLRSSTFEGNLLKATWPGDAPVPPELLSEIVKYSIPAFKYTRSDSEDDPYVMTMHKLWMKMSEKDWRTISKSLYILHCISRDCSVDACKRFADAVKDMSKTRNPKKPDQRYFDVRIIGEEVDKNSETYELFMREYSKYVLTRSKFFSSRFEELQSLNEKTTEKKLIATLTKAKQLLQQGLKVAVEKNHLNAITGDIIKLLTTDLRDLWQLYVEKLSLLIAVPSVPLPPTDNETTSESTSTSSSATSSASEESIRNLVSFSTQYGKALKEYIQKMVKLYKPLNIKIVPMVAGKGKNSPMKEKKSAEVKEVLDLIDLENVQEKYKQLFSLSGGAIGGKSITLSASLVAKAVDEDDEEEEEEEGDDDEDNEEDEDDNEEGEEEDDDDEEAEEESSDCKDEEDDEDCCSKEESCADEEDDDDEDKDASEDKENKDANEEDDEDEETEDDDKEEVEEEDSQDSEEDDDDDEDENDEEDE